LLSHLELLCVGQRVGVVIVRFIRVVANVVVYHEFRAAVLALGANRPKVLANVPHTRVRVVKDLPLGLIVTRNVRLTDPS